MNQPSSQSIEKFIEALRKSGLSKVSSIACIASHFDFGLEDAKRLVHESTAWNDLKAAHETFHEQITGALKKDDTKPEEA